MSGIQAVVEDLRWLSEAKPVGYEVFFPHSGESHKVPLLLTIMDPAWYYFLVYLREHLDFVAEDAFDYELLMSKDLPLVVVVPKMPKAKTEIRWLSKKHGKSLSIHKKTDMLVTKLFSIVKKMKAGSKAKKQVCLLCPSTKVVQLTKVLKTSGLDFDIFAEVGTLANHTPFVVEKLNAATALHLLKTSDYPEGAASIWIMDAFGKSA